MESLPTVLRPPFARYRGRLTLAVQYLTGQGLLQAVNVLNGFFLLRWLGLDEQAKFSLAMGLQASLGLLADLGFGGSLTGLVGGRTDDKRRIGQYIRGIQFYKNRLLLVSLTVGTGLVAFYGRRQGWGLDFWLMYALLVVSIQAQSRIGYYSAVLQMHRNLSDFYKPQVLTAALRLTVSFALFAADHLSALAVLTLTTLGFAFSAGWMQRSALAYFVPAPRPEPLVRREIVRTLVPVMPMVLFYAVQGQLTTFLAGIFGQAANVAEVGALARLGQLFALLGPFNAVVLLPYFARATNDQLTRRFGTVLLGATALMLPVVSAAYAFPGGFVWLLGRRFGALRGEMGPYVLASALYYLSSVLWAINLARRWNTGVSTALYVGLTLGMQVWGIAVLDVSTTHGAVLLNLITAGCTVAGYSVASLAGLRKQNRTLTHSHLFPTNPC